MAKKSAYWDESQRFGFEMKLEGADELVAMLKAIGEAAEAVVREATEAGAELLEQEFNSRAPGPHNVHAEDRGAIERGFVQFKIGPDKKHWFYRFFESGATAHEITPSVKKALEIPGGYERPVMRADHPGFAAEPFMRPGMQAAKERVMKLIGEQMWELMQKRAR